MLAIYMMEYNGRTAEPLVLTEADMLFVLDLMDNPPPPTDELIRAAKDWFDIEDRNVVLS